MPTSGSVCLELQPAAAELRTQYGAYRTRQARGLLGLLPAHAIRPLYRAARAWLGLDGSMPAADPMETLVRYCEHIMPLPPFEVWMEDVTLRPESHLRDIEASADVPTPEAPASVAARGFEHDGASWVAHLRVFRDRATWRGFIAFEERASSAVHSTAPIFRERDANEIRERFLGFEISALEAFLRSALP